MTDEYREWVTPLMGVPDFLASRGWRFWVAVCVAGGTCLLFLVLLPGDRMADRAATRLADVEATTADQVLWHVVNGELEDVAVVVQGPSGEFTVDVVGVDGRDEVNAYDGWQPAPTNAGANDWLPPLNVRVDLEPPTVAMREVDIGDYLHRHRPVIDIVMASAGALGLVAAVLLAVRDDRIRRPPRRRLARRH